MDTNRTSKIRNIVRMALKLANFAVAICGLLSMFGGVTWAFYHIFISWGMWTYIAGLLSASMGLWAQFAVFHMFTDQFRAGESTDSPPPPDRPVSPDPHAGP